MLSMLVWSAVDCEFIPGWIKKKTEIAALRSKSKDWFAWNREYVSEWSNMCMHGLMFQ